MPLLNTACREDELADRTRCAPSQQGADRCGKRERNAVNNQQRVAYVPVGGQYLVHGLKKGDVYRVAASIETLREPEILRSAEFHDVRHIVLGGRGQQRGGDVLLSHRKRRRHRHRLVPISVQIV